MPKYEVTIKKIEIYTMEVEADSEDDAIEKGDEMVETKQGEQKHHHDSDAECSAFEI